MRETTDALLCLSSRASFLRGKASAAADAVSRRDLPFHPAEPAHEPIDRPNNNAA